jgi:hypothetical protein
MSTTLNFPHNITAVIDYDPDAESPRTWDNVGTLALFHSRYSWDEANLSIEEAQALTLDPNYLTLPVYMYEHSGIELSTAPFSCIWDSGQLGIIFTTVENAKHHWGEHPRETYLEYLGGEVETFSKYLEGEIYWFSISQNGKHLEACGGYYEEDYAISEATAQANYLVAQISNELELAYNGM